MAQISYAQNYEDILISRLFKKSTGFYVDVGAADPNVDSVTKFFYKKGWSGINVEPNAEYYEMLQKERPRDINMWCAVSDQEGEAIFRFVKNDPKLSSIEPLSEELIRQGKLEVLEQRTRLTTLRKILADQEITRVDFLKIDAEGAETKVLAGFPFETVKPRLVVMEAVEAKSAIPTRQNWAFILERHGYERVYFDGFNDYYVQGADVEAKKLYEVPLNLLDDFIRFEHTRVKAFFKHWRG